MNNMKMMNMMNQNKMVFSQPVPNPKSSPTEKKEQPSDENKDSENINDNNNNLLIYFDLFREDKPEEEPFRLVLQTKSDEKFKEIIQKYCGKLEKTENVIKKLIFNENEISKNSEETAAQIKLTNKCLIKAFTDASFDNKNEVKAIPVPPPPPPPPPKL